MNYLFSCVLLVLSVFGSSVLSAADSKSPSPGGANVTAQGSVAGKYSGKWKGPENTGGDLSVTLKQEGAGPWSAEASFTFEDTEIPTKMKSVEVDGSRIRMVFTWQIQETPGQSAMTGELTGDKLHGTYETTGPAGETKGTWSMTRS
jgi:hypothetical protein